MKTDTATPTSDAATALEHSALFKFVPTAERGQLLKAFTREHYSFGDPIVTQGEPADAFFVILSANDRAFEIIFSNHFHVKP